MDVKEVVQTARLYIEEVFADEDTSNTRLEEVDYNSKDAVWNVTFSFLRPTGMMSGGDILFPSGVKGRNVRRDYKVVVVDSASGQATSIRHRSLEPAE